MQDHYIITFGFIALIVFFQIKTFINTTIKIKVFKNIFPNNGDKLQLDYESENNNVKGITFDHNNSVFKVIISSINKYLLHNKGAVSDFHLMKDILDRNCDAIEEEINTLNPVPLYYGLVGTMMGILIGVGILVMGGGLAELLESGGDQVAVAEGVSEFKNSTAGINQLKKGADGIQTLMGGIALAMISSILGILLSTIGSLRAKDAKANLDVNKNTFLSWIQSELLPNLSNDTAQTLQKLSQNLTNFNRTFSSNTKELRETLLTVNSSYQDLATILNVINNMKISQIASANIAVYDKLKNCTVEIGELGQYLSNVNQYLNNVRALNDNLERNENRTKAIEDMGLFFQSEIQQISVRKTMISDTINSINLDTRNVIEQFKEDSKLYLVKLKENLDSQLLEFNKAVVDQQQLLKHRLEETSVLVAELKNLTAVKLGINNLEKATTEQNRKLSQLAESINELAQVKATGGTIKPLIPKWIKITVISTLCLISVTCLTVLIPLLVKYISNLINQFF